MAEPLLNDGVNMAMDLFDDEPAPSEAPSPASDGAYDPAEDTVNGVKKHVKDHGDLDEVLAAEVAGKNRKSLVKWLEDQKEPAGDGAGADSESEED